MSEPLPEWPVLKLDSRMTLFERVSAESDYNARCCLAWMARCKLAVEALNEYKLIGLWNESVASSPNADMVARETLIKIGPLP